MCARSGLAYFENGLDNPHLYDVMFHRPLQEFTPEPEDVAFALSTLGDLEQIVQRCIDAGVMVGEADDISRELWAVTHGITSLAIAQMLEPTDAKERLVHLMRATVDGYRREAELSSTK